MVCAVICPLCYASTTVEDTDIGTLGRERARSCSEGCGRFSTLIEWGSAAEMVVEWESPVPVSEPVDIVREVRARARKTAPAAACHRPVQTRARSTWGMTAPAGAVWRHEGGYYKRGLRSLLFVWRGTEWVRSAHDDVPEGAVRV